MSQRHSHVAGMVAAVAAAAATAVWVTIASRSANWPQLRPATTSPAITGVRVSPNIHVSSPAGTINHMGCALAADPTDPLRLFAASTQGDTYDNVVGYASHDGGTTWRLSCTRPHAPDEQVADEDVAFGPHGVLYFVNMRNPRSTPGAHRYGTVGAGNIDFAASTDGGLTWEERGSVARYIDRPCLAVGAGRVYVHANIEEPVVVVSNDGTRTLSACIELKPQVRSTRPSNPVVLADGSVLVTSAVFVTGSDHHVELPLWRLGGAADPDGSWTQVTPNLAGRWKHARIKSSSVFDVFYPRLAAGLATTPGGAQPVYCVWRDGHASDESYILFSRSLDAGTTWSTPVIVSEQPAGVDAAPDYAADIPAIAVNTDGVVAVTWYDRRGLPRHTVGPNGVIAPVPGYNARIRISRDGGESWEPSVQLNEVPMKGNRIEARHWTGLAAAADGRFHATWIGDSTGTRQVWTAAIVVTR